ncbi:Ig-like domain-containing protein [Natrinema versiforme]|uniref:Ig-like domain-containing protein n=1 Tax=Natrinema versiforme TaxID=88724 RepID=A0A4P8WM03_9EURY|nr:Ig-like domain-containing protein [Natrinema versiforme]QCS43253.1 Ig-like domain-containing protein [Natrinema versiforme]
MRSNAKRKRTETRSIQSSVQILLTVSGIVFLLAGLVLAASGASISGAVGSVTDRWDGSAQPAGDDADQVTDDTGGADSGDGANGTSGGDEPAETDGGDGGTDAGNESDGSADDGDTGDETHVLTAVVETQDGDTLDNATVTVSGAGTTTESGVGQNGEADFERANGDYTVTADADGYRTAETTVGIDGDDATVPLTLEERSDSDGSGGDSDESDDSNSTDDDDSDDSDGPYTLAVTVEDQNGSAVDTATVELEDDSGIIASSEEKAVDDDGEVEFERESEEYTVIATADGYSETERTVEIDGSDRETTLTIAEDDG